MISVSDGFKSQLNNDKRQFLYRLKFTLADTTQLTLTNRHLWSNSLRFSGATSGSGTFDVGAFVIGRLSFIINDIYDDFGDSYDFNLAQVNLEIGLELANNTTEYIQVGKYVVDDVSYNGMLISLDCLDYGYYFDTEWDTALTFPTTVGAVVREACTQCGITLSTQSWDGINTVISTKPDNNNLTWRAAVGYAVQMCGQYAKLSPYGQLIVSWYDIDHLSQVTVDGSLLDAHDARVLDHIDDPILMTNKSAVRDAWDSLTSAEKGRYARIRHISRVNVGHYPILITGVRCTVGRGDNAQSYTTGSSGYVIDVSENPFIDTNNANTVITAIAGNTVGFYFYTFDTTYLSMPHYQAGDLCWIEDPQKGRIYCSFITNFEFTAGSYQSSSCGAETPAQKATAPYTPSMKILAEMGRATRASLDNYEAIAKNMAELISNGMGLYFTKEPQSDGSNIYYMHDKPTMAASSTIWKVTSQGFLASTDNGVTWAVDQLGNALYNVITARGLNADWINTGAFTVRDANNNVTFQADTATGSVIINASSFRLSGAPINQAVNVGARNLLYDTEDARSTAGSSSGSVYTSYYNATPYGQQFLSEADKLMTISFQYEVTGNSATNANIYVQCNGSRISVDEGSGYGSAVNKNVYDNPSGEYIRAFRVTSSQASASSKRIRIRMRYATDDAVLTVKHVKLEVGNTVTDWTPAPEDLQDGIDTALTTANTANDTANQALQVASSAGGLVMMLDNDYDSIPTDPDGSYVTFPVGISTTATVFYNSADVTGSCTFGTPVVSNCSGTWNATTHTYTVTDMSSSHDTAYVSISATYNNMTVSKKFSLAKLKQGVGGTDGADGADGRGISSVVNYYGLSTSNTVQPDGWGGDAWGSNVKTPNATYPYLWNFERTNYSDGTRYDTTPHVIGNYSADGADGANGTNGRGISSITEYYGVSSSSSTEPSTWSTSMVTTTTINRYLWNYEFIEYTDNTSELTTKRIIGTHGETGAPGSNSRLYFLEVTPKQIKRAAGTNSFQPNTITVNSYSRDGSSTTKTAYTASIITKVCVGGSTWTNLGFIQRNSVSFTVQYVSGSTPSVTGSGGSYTLKLPTGTSSIRFQLSTDSAGTNLLDQQDILVVDESYIELTQENVFNALTNNGTLEGVFMEDNNLYINASYIKSGQLVLGGANNLRGTLRVNDGNGNLCGGINNTEIYHKDPSNSDKISMREGGLYFYKNTSTVIGSIYRSTYNGSDSLSIYSNALLSLSSNGDISLWCQSSNHVYPGIRVIKDDNFPLRVEGKAAYQWNVKIPISISNGAVTDYVNLRIVDGIVYTK